MVKRYKPGHDHRYGYGGHHGRRLNDSREQCTYQHEEQRIGDTGEKIFHCGQGCKLVHCACHHAQSDKEHTEAGQYAAHLLGHIVLCKEHNKRSYACKGGKNERGGYAARTEHTESDELGGNGCTDVGTVNDSRRLIEAHYAHVDETYHHHRYGTATLYGGSTDGTYSYAKPTLKPTVFAAVLSAACFVKEAF